MDKYKILFKLFPDLFSELSCFECEDGWFELIKELSQKINDIIVAKNLDCYVSQVKEKFGTLRYYMSSETDEISDLITQYENKSRETCESCGKPGKLNEGSWYKVRCGDCK